MKDTSVRSAALTGAGSGLGRDISLGLAAKNYRVFGTARTDEDVADLREASAGAVALTRVDITDEAAVERWAHDVATQAEGELDLLISNAGILTPGPLELVPLDAIRHEFEVNTFGPLAVINAFLPALRKARGRIVQISTMTARFPLPFNGPSGASKAAMEVFATVYRSELKPFGIDVVIVEPGSMRTGGPAKSAAALTRVADEMTPEQRQLYGDRFQAFTGRFNQGQSAGLASGEAAAKVIELAEQIPAPRRAPVGPDAEEILRIVRDQSDAEQDAFRLEVGGIA